MYALGLRFLYRLCSVRIKLVYIDGRKKFQTTTSACLVRRLVKF